MHIIILVTAPSKKEAAHIAQVLVKDKLAACVNIVGKIDSLFWWQGKVDRAKEMLLVIKSRKKMLNRIIKRVRALHSYDCPEIVAVPIIGGYKQYLKWIDESLR
jgi:periplasmic divalent cation tolerance protein